MKKNILKKFIVLFSLVFVLFGYNLTFAIDEIIPDIGTVSDTTAPIITIKGINPVELYIGDEYIEEGATAIDDIDGDITSFVVVVNNIDINTNGNYTVTYNVLDTAGNSATEVTRIVNVKTPVVSTPTVVVNNITVKDICTVVDTDGLEHIFPAEDSENNFLGVCAIVAAKEAGYIDSFELVNDPSMGLYLKNINSTVLGSSEYWALWVNDDYATCGIGCLPVLVGDTLEFILSDWAAETESTKISFNVSALEATVVEEEIEEIPVVIPASSGGGSSGGSTSTIEEKTFSVENALSFLSQNQNSDGSFDSPMYTDWAAIAAKAGNDSNLKSSILNYLKSNPVNSSIITDHERRAMAIMALGINPYSGTEVNYIDKIISAFDGSQIGDSSLYNDDIFGLIVLANSGYSKNDEIIKNTVSFIIKNQSSNGSWGSVDMTGAAILSLNNFKSLSGVNDAISKGELYLKSAQKNDGGFENPSSTSWAIQALSLNSSFDEEVKKAINYLATQQQNDLALDNNIDINNRVWATAYAIPAALKLSWSDILESFEKEEMLTEVPIKEYKLIENKITQTNKLNNIENNINPNTSLQASVALASETNNPSNNKSFLHIVDQVIYGFKAPFVWFWNILSILL
ncbi:MAG: DUF5011 domain-containing protein [Candidatus Pacebacteria bacterium]|nr:DUF5011 domain-containing protein [Candidatus Paceibacterota bacterium]